MPDDERVPLALDQFQADFAAWADATFPHSTPRSRARHLFREAIELVCATHQGEDPDLLAAQLTDDLTRELAKERARRRRCGRRGRRSLPAPPPPRTGK